MTKEDRQKLYAALAAPFAETAIERSDGQKTGRGYDTTGIKYQYVVNRLNEVLGVGGFQVERTMAITTGTTAKGRPSYDAVCEIRLRLGAWEGGAFVPFAEAIGDGGHTSISEIDARKGAYTNAFKKAAAFHGVGRQAYEGTLDDDNVPGERDAVRTLPARPATQPRPAAPTSAAPAAQPTTQAGRTEAPAARAAASVVADRSRLTSKQLNAILSIARSRGHDEKTLREQVRVKYSCTLDYLSRAQASEVIATMNANGYDRQPGPAA